MQIKFRICNHSGVEVSNTPLGGLVQSVPLSVCFVLMKLILIPLIIMMSDVDDDYVIVVAAADDAAASGFPLLLLLL